ncbi:MAG: hypothetical protein HZA50_11330 [Planctomycetes bacterium]|nr:hypothetical protein [Planctomycetota bacterium]
MKNVALMLAVVAALGLVVGAFAAAGADKPTTLEGKVTKAVNDKCVLEVTAKDAKEATKVETSDKTVVTIDGKEAKVADLKEGMAVVVTPDKGLATKIEAKKAEEPKHKH